MTDLINLLVYVMAGGGFAALFGFWSWGLFSAFKSRMEVDHTHDL